MTLYIRYNSFGEYSYHLQFISKQLDRIRFDNMDDRWMVSTTPHHLHIRNRDDIAKDSDMVGNPVTDIPVLVSFIESGKMHH